MALSPAPAAAAAPAANATPAGAAEQVHDDAAENEVDDEGDERRPFDETTGADALVRQVEQVEEGLHPVVAVANDPVDDFVRPIDVQQENQEASACHEEEKGPEKTDKLDQYSHWITSGIQCHKWNIEQRPM